VTGVPVADFVPRNPKRRTAHTVVRAGTIPPSTLPPLPATDSDMAIEMVEVPDDLPPAQAEGERPTERHPPLGRSREDPYDLENRLTVARKVGALAGAPGALPLRAPSLSQHPPTVVSAAWAELALERTANTVVTQYAQLLRDVRRVRNRVDFLAGAAIVMMFSIVAAALLRACW